MTNVKKTNKTSGKKKGNKEKFELVQTTVKGVTTENLLSKKFIKEMKSKFGEVTFPMMLIILQKEESLIILEQGNKKSIENKILSINYSPEKISTKNLIELKELLKNIGD